MSKVANHLVRCAKLSSETSNLVHLSSRYKEEAVFDAARTFLLSGILGTTNRNSLKTKSYGNHVPMILFSSQHTTQKRTLISQLELQLVYLLICQTSVH